MADRWVALIRGINVGRAKRVAMADLRTLVADLGYSDVRTLLNSGNVVFAADSETSLGPAARIQEAMTARLGVSARVIALSASELADAVRSNPLTGIADDPSRLIVAFLENRSDMSRLDGLAQQDWSPEVLALGDGVAYLWCPGGVSDSRLGQAVGGILGDAVTGYEDWLFIFARWREETAVELTTLYEERDIGREFTAVTGTGEHSSPRFTFPYRKNALELGLFWLDRLIGRLELAVGQSEVAGRNWTAG